MKPVMETMKKFSKCFHFMILIIPNSEGFSSKNRCGT